MPVINPIGVQNPLGVNVPVGNPLSNPVVTSVTQPTLVGNIVATPVAQGLTSAGFVGVFASMGIASKVKQRKMIGMRNVVKSKAPAGQPSAGDTGSIGVME